jgi:sec-independent protein translocase protein TatC
MIPAASAQLMRGGLLSYPDRIMSAAAPYRLPPEDPEEREGFGFSILEKLDEFRRRVVRSALAVAVGMVVAFFFLNRLVAFVLEPLRRMMPPGSRLIYTNPAEAFSLYMQVALIAGALMAAPYVLFQLWRFIAPALYVNVKRFMIPFVLLTCVGCLAGAAFSHYVVYPYMIAFFGTFSTPDVTFMPRVEDAFGLYVKMLIGMAIVFQIPTLAFFLGKMRLLTARLLWRNTKYAILAIFVVSAVVTPSSDPWNQTVFAAPMVVLYLLSIGIVWLVGPKKAARTPWWDEDSD